MKNAVFSGVTCYNLRRSVSSSPLSNKLNVLVLESDPTPNYYAKNNFPENKHVHSWKLYLPVRKAAFCFQDIILRNAPLINEKIKSDFKISPGQMTIFNENHACIRISSNNVEKLPLLIEEFKKLDIRFNKSKEIAEFESTIYYKRYTEFVKIGDGIYKNRINGNHYYFEVPVLLSFDEFINGMEEIKNNCNFHLFDSFLTSIFLENKTQDFIGIYSEHCDKNRFGDLENEIKKVFQV